MKITTKFNINQKIYINDLKVYGKILSIFVSGNLLVQYNVRFFNGYDPKEVYFLEEEISFEKPEEAVGFKSE